MSDVTELHKRLASASRSVPSIEALRGVMDKAAQAGAEAARKRQLSVRASIDPGKGLTLRFAGKGAYVARDAARRELERLVPQASATLRDDLIRVLEGR